MALGLTDFSGTVGGNISGTSDLAPLDQQAAMIQELFRMPRASVCSTAVQSRTPSTSAMSLKAT